VLSAADGQQAVDIVSERRPGLILLDLRMPMMDGWQVVELLESDAALARLPIMIHTAYHDLTPPSGLSGTAADQPTRLRFDDDSRQSWINSSRTSHPAILVEVTARRGPFRSWRAS